MSAVSDDILAYEVNYGDNLVRFKLKIPTHDAYFISEPTKISKLPIPWYSDKVRDLNLRSRGTV